MNPTASASASSMSATTESFAPSMDMEMFLTMLDLAPISYPSLPVGTHPSQRYLQKHLGNLWENVNSCLVKQAQVWHPPKSLQPLISSNREKFEAEGGAREYNLTCFWYTKTEQLTRQGFRLYVLKLGVYLIASATMLGICIASWLI